MVGLCGSEGESPASTPSSGVFGGGIARVGCCLGVDNQKSTPMQQTRRTGTDTRRSAGLLGASEGARRNGLQQPLKRRMRFQSLAQASR
jgi:hypothetical protein